MKATMETTGTAQASSHGTLAQEEKQKAKMWIKLARRIITIDDSI